MAAQPKVAWESGLFDCFEDASTCCYGYWCCPCLAGTVSERFGENYCLPLCDLCPAITAAFGVPLLVPPAALSLRIAMRNRYGIEGSICKDIAISCCCSVCSWCQMHRELKHRKKAPTVINVVQTQPAPVMFMQPTPGIQMQPTPVTFMQPTPGIQMQPTPVTVMQPTPGIQMQPTPVTVMQPTPGIQMQPTPVMMAPPVYHTQTQFVSH